MTARGSIVLFNFAVAICAICAICAISGCSTKKGPDAIDAAPPDAAAADASTTPEASVPTGTCSLDRGFQGTIGKLDVLARLDRAGGALTGHYLYTKVGIDLPLAGTLTDAGVLTLTEGDAQSPTGHFSGQCAPDGHLRGTWQKAPKGESLPFDLAPIEPRDEMIVATRRKSRRFPPKPRAAGSSDGGFAFEPKQACVEEITWPEIFGARTADDERAINRALTNDGWVFADHEAEAQLKACAIGDRAEARRTFEIAMNRSGLFAVRELDAMRFESGTHPWDPGAESWLAFDTRSGGAIAKKDLLPTAKPALAAMTRLLDKCNAEFVRDDVGDPSALPDVKERVSLDNLALLVQPTDKGLHFAATGYPPPARVLEGEGPTITWAALLGAGALPTGGEGAARAWAGVTPAKPTDDPCVKPVKK